MQRIPPDFAAHIFKIERLDAMPHIVWQLIEALNDERTTPASLEELITSDPALTSKILKLANSVYYNVAEPVKTISRAIVIIGFRELEILALGSGLAGIFNIKHSPDGLNVEDLWRHSLAVSWMAREMADLSNQSGPAEIMIAGLLHDLGKLVLASHLTEELAQIAALTQQGIPFYLAEEQLSLKHTTIGYWLAKRWNLPEIHVSAIRNHHFPQTNDPYYTFDLPCFSG